MRDEDQTFRAELVELLPRLRRFAYSLCGSRDAGDDLVQSAMERALRRQETWKPGTRLDSWMYRITQNLWIDQLRAAKVRGVHASMDDTMQLSGEDGRVTAENRIMLARTRAEMNRLPEEQRAIVSLVLIEGFSYREAAETLEIPIGTVMSRLSRARQTLTNRVLGPDLES